MLNRKIRFVMVLTSALMVAAITFGVLLSQVDEREDIYKKLDIFIEVMSHIRSDYVEPVRTTMIFDGALKGMARMLDSESSYLTAEEYHQYQEELPKRVASTGIEVVKNPLNGYAQVVFIRPESPADSSGVFVGDLIRAVDEQSTRELPIMMIELLMRGEPGSSASFSIVRANMRQFLTFDVERKILPQRKVSWEKKDGAGYIHIPSFDLGTLEAVQSAVNEFKAESISDLIIDIRGNLGGNLEEAVHVADLFIKEGLLVSLKTKQSSTEYTADEFAYDFNIYLLCDESTGRAAEFFAAALSAQDFVEVVGRNTLGIGTIQKSLELEEGALLNISYARVLGPGDLDISASGIGPDHEVPKTTGEKESDEILGKALELVRNADTTQQLALSLAS
ncbi:MAG TPA: S41 family peptidase [Acidobacteriota bacterium]|nr:S41 family peptidase [Acidobacteriota bacterium]